MFPVWLRFRGGKGVATAVGVFLILAPLALAITGAVFLLIVWRTRYVSLGSMVAAAILPWIIFAQSLIMPRVDVLPVVSAAIVVSFLIIYAHRANIERLFAGSESRFN